MVKFQSHTASSSALSSRSPWQCETGDVVRLSTDTDSVTLFALSGSQQSSQVQQNTDAFLFALTPLIVSLLFSVSVSAMARILESASRPLL